jgi:hypothetical protein
MVRRHGRPRIGARVGEGGVLRGLPLAHSVCLLFISGCPDLMGGNQEIDYKKGTRRLWEFCGS